MLGLWKTWKALEAKGIMGINRRNADYVLKYNKRHLYPIVDDKIITKERAIEAGIHVPELYGVISTEKEIDKLGEIIGERSDFVVKPAQGAGGDGILLLELGQFGVAFLDLNVKDFALAAIKVGFDPIDFLLVFCQFRILVHQLGEVGIARFGKCAITFGFKTQAGLSGFGLRQFGL